jgi:hypothetical protein
MHSRRLSSRLRFTLSLALSLFLVSSDAFGANELGCELGLAHGATENGP